MKILVFSDSHSSLRFMRECISAVSPDCILHLGDMFEDGQVIARENPGVLFYQVPGNCDAYRCPPDASEVLIPRIGGVDFFITHGHRYHVKQYTGQLLQAARERKAAAVLYGHTHMEECTREPDGLWVMNPGSCGYFGGTAGLIEVKDKRIQSCRIIRHGELEGKV